MSSEDQVPQASGGSAQSIATLSQDERTIQKIRRRVVQQEPDPELSHHAVFNALEPLAQQQCSANLSRLLSGIVLDHLRRASVTHVRPPNPRIAASAINVIRCSQADPFLLGMLAKLISSTMSPSLQKLAHPAFVKIIEQLLPTDARVLLAFRHRESFPVIWFRTRTCSEM
jgi:hypothetical protein